MYGDADMIPIDTCTHTHTHTHTYTHTYIHTHTYTHTHTHDNNAHAFIHLYRIYMEDFFTTCMHATQVCHLSCGWFVLCTSAIMINGFQQY